MGADERQNIAADLREQIEEMLSDRARQSGKPVAIEDVEAVLSELDPPESYTEAGPAQRGRKTRSFGAVVRKKPMAGVRVEHSIAAVLGGSGANIAWPRRCGRRFAPSVPSAIRRLWE